MFYATAVLVGVTSTAFAPVLHNGFTNYDDPLYITDNPYLRLGFTWRGLRWASTAMYAMTWHPLTWCSHLIDYSVFGLHPAGHHAVSLALHVASCAVLFLILAHTTGALWCSLVAAGIFAVHPLRVESVAWACERKDVLSTFCFMLTVASYIWYTRAPSLRRYMAVVILLSLGVLAKAMVVTTPVVLLLLDVWPLKRLRPGASTGEHPRIPARVVAEKLPLLLPAMAAAFLVISAGLQSGAVASLEAIPFGARAANALLSYVRYMVMTVYPINLAVPYPYPPHVSAVWSAAAGIVVVAASVVALRVGKRRPYIFVGWWWYVVMLLPVIGIIQAGNQAYADRFTYLPQIGLVIIIVWGAAEWMARVHVPAGISAPIVGAVIVILSALTYRQAKVWHSSVTLFTHTLAVTGDNAAAYINLGAAFEHDGDLDGAMHNYKEVLRVHPNDATARNDLAGILEKRGDRTGAIRWLLEALALTAGKYADAHYNLGRVLAAEGRADEARDHYRDALMLRPDYVEPMNNLGQLLLGRGDAGAAIGLFKRALTIRPDFADAHTNLGIALRRESDLEGAVREYQAAIRLDPASAQAWNNLGNVYAQMGRLDDAAHAFGVALQFQPGFTDARLNLGDLLARQGNFIEAARHFEDALHYDPQSREAREKLQRARALSTDTRD